MAQSLAKVAVHLIFSTKDRRPLIAEAVQEKLDAYMTGALRNMDCPSIIVKSVEDHIHVLFFLSRNHALSMIVKELKVESSKWMKRQGLDGFRWQGGYGAFSVSQSRIESVKKYIADQEAHHRKVTFEEEFRRFLKRHQVEYDERYVWD